MDPGSSELILPWPVRTPGSRILQIYYLEILLILHPILGLDKRLHVIHNIALSPRS